jgi:N-acetylmuramoyl-L-alanine amidase
MLLTFAATFLFVSKTKLADQIEKNENPIFTLIVDAGHGGRDDGTNYKGVKEKDITLAIARKIDSLAPQYGIKVFLTRNADVFLNPIQRVNIASRQKADAYISIHVNELRGYEYVSGMQVYVSNQNPAFDQSRLIGSAVAQSLSAGFKVSNKLYQRAENIWVLGENMLPSVLVECGFITNPHDMEMLTSNAQLTLIASNILKGVTAYAKHESIYQYQVQYYRAFNSHNNYLATSRTTLHRKRSFRRNSKTA